ncbi:MAG: glycosyl transferase [Francisellaceae bacterium]|nr:glycosyl transferase [Francisellaceae bacterium]
MINLRQAVLIPCYKEEKTVQAVVENFKKELPTAKIYVYDNNSPDLTKENALKVGAIVRTEKNQGKGHVVRRMFSDIEADIYILVDGDNTYDAKSIHKMINLLKEHRLDMVVGSRVPENNTIHRKGHQLGNNLFNKVIELLFRPEFKDIFSGYRVFSRRFVKSFPCLSTGFEIETEISVHALEMNLPVGEYPTPYFARPEGSFSKLSTFKDGFKVLKTILKLLKQSQPFHMFFLFFLLFNLTALIFFMPILLNYIDTGLVPRIPTLVFIIGFVILGFLCLFSGIILGSVSRTRLENKRFFYLKEKMME